MSRLLVREKVFSVTGKVFEVKASFFGGPVYTIEGDISSLHDKRKMYDGNGRKLYEMKTRILSARRSMVIKNGRTGAVVATLRRAKYMPLRFTGDGNINVWRGENTDASPWFEIEGEKGGSTFTVTDNWREVEVATINKKSLTFPTIFLGKASYILEVLKGYEEPLMIMIAIAADEYYAEN